MKLDEATYILKREIDRLEEISDAIEVFKDTLPPASLLENPVIQTFAIQYSRMSQFLSDFWDVHREGK
jgi:hypothetical protein